MHICKTPNCHRHLPPPPKKGLSSKNSYFGVLKISCLLFLILAIIGCKKLDKPQEATSPENGLSIENRFFNLHRSTNAEENALIAFIQRRNDKTHFVEETVKRIGFPRWDKMFKTKAGNTKVITIQSTSTSPTKNATSFGGFNTYYVPFVRDSQNHVNATMVINTTPTDTSFGYLCDWQYNYKTLGSPSVDTSAEKFAMFFMMLNNRTLGHKEFDITDPRLFSSLKGGAAKKRIGIGSNSNKTNSAIGKLDLPIYEVCNEYYYCATPNTCGNSCDYINCSAIPFSPNNHCKPIVTICWQYFGGGSSWSYSSGNNNGGSGAGGGTGGNGNSGDLPPIPCEGEPSQASTPNKKINSNIISNSLPCGSSGWVPVVKPPPCAITKEDLKLAFPNATEARLQEISEIMNTYSASFGIDTKEEIQVFLAQCAHETASFNNLFKQEDLYYTTTSQLLKTWPKRFSLTDSTKANPNDYLRNPEKLGEKVYSIRNGNNLPGDGYKFRVRGAIQLTGKSNYQEFQTFYNANFQPPIDIISTPDLLLTDVRMAFLCAMNFFKKNVLSKLTITSTTTVEEITLIVNNGLNGLSDRQTKTNNAKTNINCH